MRLEILMPVLLPASLLIAACGSTETIEMRKTEAAPARVHFVKPGDASVYAYTARSAELARAGKAFVEPRPLSATEGMAVVRDVAAKFSLSEKSLRNANGALPKADVILTPNEPVASGGSLKAYCAEYVTGDSATGWIILFARGDAKCVYADKFLDKAFTTNVQPDENDPTVFPPPGLSVEFTGLTPGAAYVLDLGLSPGPVGNQVLDVTGPKGQTSQYDVTDGHVTLSFVAETEIAAYFLARAGVFGGSPGTGSLFFHFAGLTRVTK